MSTKVLDRLFFKQFIGPCLLAFFIVEFVLIMQNLWKVIDDILGKGYGMIDYLELLSYFGLAIIPMSLPLTILLSSVMVYGDMAEKYELSSAKSAGISFVRLLRPGLVIAISIFFFSIIASNILKPQANEGFYKKMRDMKTNKLTFVFDEKIFNTEFKDFSIRIGKKEKDGRTIQDILIYDHTDHDNSVVNVIRAKHGEMYTTEDQKFLVMDLEDGYQFKEIRQESADRRRKGYNAFARPLMRFNFSSLRKVFNLTDMLDLNVVNVSYRQYEMMNTFELKTVIDSLNQDIDEVTAKNIHEFNLLTKRDTVREMEMEEFEERRDSLRATISYNGKSVAELRKVTERALSSQGTKRYKIANDKKVARAQTAANVPIIHFEGIGPNTKSLEEIVEMPTKTKTMDLIRKNALALKTNNSNNGQEIMILERSQLRYIFKLHQMYSWATVCIIFLFIGAPAGAIVRKGGFGFPLLIAIGFYLTFVMSSIIGEKLMSSGALTPEMGAWFPCLLLLPFAAYLSWRALHDNKPIFRPLWNRLRGKRSLL